MFLRKIVTTVLKRNYSAKQKMLDVLLKNNGYTVVTLHRPPINALNTDFLVDLSLLLEKLKKDKSKGMILTSFSDKVFSIGIDVKELVHPDVNHVNTLWKCMQDIWILLYGSSFPTVAIINGVAPGAGCFLTLCCDYRIIVRNAFIGFNEHQVGVPPPFLFVQAVQKVVSKRQAELALMTGQLFNAEEALNIGLVDDVASDKIQALSKAEAFLERFETISPTVYAAHKYYTRGLEIEKIQKNRKKELEITVGTSYLPMFQENYKAFIKKAKFKKQNKM